MQSKFLGAMALASVFSLSACVNIKMPETHYKIKSDLDRILHNKDSSDLCRNDDTCSIITISPKKPFSDKRSVTVDWEYRF